MTCTYDFSFDTTCQIVSCATPLLNQLVMKKIHLGILWYLISRLISLFLEQS